MSDIVVDIENRLAWTDEPESGRRKDGELLMRAHDEIVTLRAELADQKRLELTARMVIATRDRRAALVAEWADGLRAGKRYAVTVDGREWFACTRGGDDKYFSAGVRRASEGIEELAETSAVRAAAYMLAVSDQWQEVEP